MNAMTLLWRNWRSGELGILLGALTLAVTLVVAMSGLMTQFERVLTAQSSRLMAADFVVQGLQVAPEQWLQEAQQSGLAVAQTVSFPTMVFGSDDAMQLCNIKAVSADYPLRGQLERAETPYGEPQATNAGPQSGEAWLESRLFALLNVAIGDDIAIGEANFTVAAVLRSEPDQGGSMFALGPRVMINNADLDKTGVLMAGSRASYRSLFAGEREQVSRFQQTLTQRLGDDYSVMDAQSGPSAMARALGNARSYLLLAASLGVILAGIALILAARRFALRHLDDVAIMKSLGARAGQIRRAYGLMLIYVAMIGVVLGSALGAAAQWLLLSQLMPEADWHLTVAPFLLGAITACVTLACFAWPPIYRLGAANPLRVLRRDLPSQTVREYRDIALGLAGLLGLMWFYSGNLVMTLAVCAGIALIALLTTALSVVLLRSVRGVGMQAGSVWRLALSGLVRHRSANTLQVVIFALCFMLLFVLVLLRNTLLGDWRAQVPEGAPNHFMLNLNPDQVPRAKTVLSELGLASEQMYPMSRARIIAINGELLPDATIQSDDARARRRESNLSASAELPADNTLVAGSWWDESPYDNPISVEQGYAEESGLQVGDTIQYQVGSQRLDVTVGSIRTVRWESLKPNFFVLLKPDTIATLPAVWMTSFYLPAEQKSQLNTLVKAFPTVSIIEVDAMIAQVQQMLGKVAMVIEVIVVLMLVAAALVMLAAVRASIDVRLRESALLRALGASRHRLLGALAVEFGVLGSIAALMALVGAELASWLLHGQLSLDYQMAWLFWPAGFVLVVAVVKVLGIASCYKTVSVSPLSVLKEG